MLHLFRAHGSNGNLLRNAIFVVRLGTARMALVRVSLGAWPAFVTDTWDRTHGAGSCLFGRMAHVRFRAWRPVCLPVTSEADRFRESVGAWIYVGSTCSDSSSKGVNTLGDAAFVVALEASDASAKTTEIAQRMFGQGVLPGVIGRLRHLFTLAQTLAAVEMKRSIEDETGCKMPKAEREVRFQKARERLGEVFTTGHFEPSLSLISLLYGMKERDEWVHVPLSACTSRRQELAGVKQTDQLKLVNGMLKVTKEDVAEADLGTPLLARQAMTRRSLAFEVVGLATFEVLENYANQL
eukprot:589235-Amphidinium_carterae.2